VNPFEQLQQELADRIAADPLFAEVEVLWEDRGDIVFEAQKVQKQKLRCLVVNTPDAGTATGNLPGPFYDRCLVEVECLDFPAVTRGEGDDGPTARDMAHAVAALLHHYAPLATGQLLVADQPTIQRAETELTGAVVDVVRFNAPGLGSYEIPQLDAPELAVVDGTLTITGPATPGVAVFYTTNGNQPSPRSGTLYTAPVDVSGLDAGTRIRARAWLAGYLASDLASLLTT